MRGGEGGGEGETLSPTSPLLPYFANATIIGQVRIRVNRLLLRMCINRQPEVYYPTANYNNQRIKNPGVKTAQFRGFPPFSIDPNPRADDTAWHRLSRDAVRWNVRCDLRVHWGRRSNNSPVISHPQPHKQQDQTGWPNELSIHLPISEIGRFKSTNSNRGRIKPMT